MQIWTHDITIFVFIFAIRIRWCQQAYRLPWITTTSYRRLTQMPENQRILQDCNT